MQHTISEIIEQLRRVKGVQAIVLGGSRAKGTAHEHSDVDNDMITDDRNNLDQALTQLQAILEETTALAREQGGKP